MKQSRPEQSETWDQVDSSDPAARDGARGDDLRPYSPPRLEVLGDVRDLTLGGSPGVGDSGNPLTRKPPA
jgi:hypothetical protein